MKTETHLIEQLLEKQDDCYVFIVKRVKNKEQAEDILQEVNYKVVRKKDSYKEENKFWPYITKVIKNAILNDERSIVRSHTVIDPNENFYELYTYSLVIENNALPNLTIDEIMEKIRLQGEEVYRIFCMIKDGHTRKEIAEVLDKPQQEVDSIIEKTRKMLRVWYEANY